MTVSEAPGGVLQLLAGDVRPAEKLAGKLELQLERRHDVIRLLEIECGDQAFSWGQLLLLEIVFRSIRVYTPRRRQSNGTSLRRTTMPGRSHKIVRCAQNDKPGFFTINNPEVLPNVEF